MKHILSILFVFILIALPGCSPSVKFEPQAELRPAKEDNAPIKIYYENDELPSAYQIIGTIKVGDNGFSIGCGLEQVIGHAILEARAVGADAIQIIEVKPPGFVSSCFRITANAIAFDMPDNWTEREINEAEYKMYCDTSSDALSPIEGIWSIYRITDWRNVRTFESGSSTDTNQCRVAIMKENNDTYDYIAIILDSTNGNWEQGYVKAKLQRTVDDNVFKGTWFNDDFSEKNITLIVEDPGHLSFSNQDLKKELEIKQTTFLAKEYPVQIGEE